MPAPLTVFPTRAALMDGAAAALLRAIEAGLSARGAATIALSGGATPEPAYAALAGKALDWPRVTIALVDERWVPPSHPASNEAMIRRALAPALSAGASLLPLWSQAPDIEAGAAHAEALYAPLRFDAALMGMGADAHTASWFPRVPGLSAALDLASPRTIIALDAPEAAGASARLTLTRAALKRAASVILLIAGEDKRVVWESAVTRDPLDAPVAALAADHARALAVLWAR